MVFLAAIVFGAVSYQRLATELMPDISYPTITVRTEFEGAAPQEIESQISRRIENQLATLDGLVTLESRSRAGLSDVVLGFDWGSDMADASQSIREKLQSVFLPAEADRPLILRYDPSLQPFLRLALSTDEPLGLDPTETLFELRRIAEQEIKQDLEGMSGVAAIRIKGGLEREIRIAIRDELLTARRLSIDQVKNALSANNVNVAGGSVLEGDTEYLIRTLSEITRTEDLKAIKVQRSDGVGIPLSDVAVVQETFRERSVVSHLNGREAVEIEIFKEADANIVEVAGRVKARIEDYRGGSATSAMMGVTSSKRLPEGFVLELLDDQAAFIEAAINNLLLTAIIGAFFAVLVLFLFLANFRATLIIGLAIPISVVLSFGPLYLFGVSLNLMSLGGLALGIGMLVDNAVVVLESIQRRLEQGEDPLSAAARGTAEVGAAVTASTLTTVAVFFPIVFVDGIAGELFGDLSIAVVASLVASLAVALFLVPTMAALRLGTTEATLTGTLSILTALGLGAGGLVMGSAVLGVQLAAFGALTVGLCLATALSGESVKPTEPEPNDEDHLPETPRAQAPARPPRRGAWQTFIAPFAWFAEQVLWIYTSVVRLVARLVSRPLLSLATAFRGRFEYIEQRYSGLLPRALRQSVGVILAAVVTLGVAAAGWTQLGTQLIPEVHQGRLVLEARMPVGTPLPVTETMISQVEDALGKHSMVKSTYSTIGTDGGADSKSDEGEHTAVIRIDLQSAADWTTSPADVESQAMDELRAKLKAFPRVSSRFSPSQLFDVENPIDAIIYGFDLDDLQLAGDSVAAALRETPGIRDVQSSLARGFPEVRIRYDREQLLRFGLDPNAVALTVRDKVLGSKATAINRGDRQLDVRVQLADSGRASIDDLRRLNINPSRIPPVPLDAVAELEEGIGPSEIRRVDQQRAVIVSASTIGFDLGGMGQTVAQRLQNLRLPSGTAATVAGQSEQMRASLSSLGFALLLAIFLVYVIMASTFESVVQPFVILLSVPLAAVGVIATLWASGIPVSVVALIGTIVLAGVVVNNAIVFVDTINQQCASGLPRDAAIAEAGRLRLRPILITTFTTVLGLLPLSFGLGDGAEIQQPLAVTIIGGLVSSTLLTLFVVPVVYRLMTRAAPPTEPAE